MVETKKLDGVPRCTLQSFVTGTLFSTQSTQNPAAECFINKVANFCWHCCKYLIDTHKKNHKSRKFLGIDQH